MRALRDDVRAGLRSLRRHPGLAACVVAVLGLGMGSAVTVFGVVDAFLLRALPYPEADRLVWVRSVNAGNPLGVSHADALDWRASGVFSGLATFNANEYSVLAVSGETESVLTTRTSSELFAVLQSQPFLGRLLAAAEDQPGAGNAVLLSHDLWQRRFAADPRVLGRSVTVDGAPYTVVGVLPPGFHFPVRSDLWLSSSAWADQWAFRNIRIDSAVGRLLPGVSIERARAALEAVNLQLERQHPETNSGIRADLLPLREVWTGTSRSGLLLLLTACGSLLLIACANVANFLLVWASARERDAAIRIACGVRPSRQVSQAAIEALLLGLAGGAVGLLLAGWGMRLVVWLLPDQLPSWIDVRVDLRAVAFALGTSLAVGLLSGVVPALRSLAVAPLNLLGQGGRTAAGSREGRWLHRGLASAEIALSLLLLVAAGLAVESFGRLRAVEPGFDSQGVLALEVHLPVFKLESYAQVLDLYHGILGDVAALPGVIQAAATTDLPLDRRETKYSWDFGIEGQSPEERQRNPRAQGHVVSAGYFAALDIPLLEGRTFEARDAQAATPGAIVSRSFAARFWHGRPAVGQRLFLGPPGAPGPAATIVGVAEDVRYESLAAAADSLDLYFPLDRLPSWPVHLVIRAQGDPQLLAAAVRRAIRNVSPELGVRDVAPLADRVARSLWQQRIWVTLFPIFSGIALLLAAAGVYSVVSHRVRQRRREIGIRLALGAQRGDVLRAVLGEVARISALGILLGLAGAIAAGRSLAALLYAVRGDDLSVLSLAALALALVSLAAGYAPLRRALQVDPAMTLSWE